jgi:hypothetical protein
MGPGAVSPWPNFFIAGVPKSGTTALYHSLRQHPQIYMCPVKEPNYFGAHDLMTDRFRGEYAPHQERNREALEAYLDGRTQHVPGSPVFEEGLYLRLFDAVKGQVAIGEASVSYFWLPGAAGAIRATVPGARLVFLLRDPAERAFSQHLAAKYYDPRMTFRECFLAGPDTKWGIWQEAGRYGTHLQRFFDLFPRNQILVHLYDDYRADPGAVLRSILSFLGVDPDFQPDVSGRYNEPLLPRFSTLHAVRRALIGDRYIGRYLPRWLRALVSRVYLRRRATVRMEPADRQMVIDHFREEVLHAARLIGRDLSHWLR